MAFQDNNANTFSIETTAPSSDDNLSKNDLAKSKINDFLKDDTTICFPRMAESGTDENASVNGARKRMSALIENWQLSTSDRHHDSEALNDMEIGISVGKTTRVERGFK